MIALPARPTTQLIVNPARFVPLCTNDMQSAKRLCIVIETQAMQCATAARTAAAHMVAAATTSTAVVPHMRQRVLVHARTQH